MLEFKNLSVKFGTNHVLDKLNVTFKKDKVTAIIGPSGIGKSTLLASICKQVKYQGQILWNKEDLSLKRQTLSLVPQDYGLFPWLTVEQNLKVGLKIRKTLASEDQHLIKLAQDLKIAQLLKRYPNELSGGQKQRVALAKAFALKPDLILLDEAFSALDSATKVQAHNLLLKELELHPTTTIMVTHDFSEALTFSEQILILNKDNYRVVDNPLKDIPTFERADSSIFLSELSKFKKQVMTSW